jgi:spoIIIJ-associated protein
MLAGLLTRMGLGMKVVLSENEDEVVADLQSGPYHEALLVRDCELLDAIEHLVDKAASAQVTQSDGASRKKLHLDSLGHRAKADIELAQAARHMAERAIAEQRTMKLGPLEPRARRVVHLTLKETEGVLTKSEGEGVFRRVCIIPKSAPTDSDDSVASVPDDSVSESDED